LRTEQHSADGFLPPSIAGAHGASISTSHCSSSADASAGATAGALTAADGASTAASTTSTAHIATALAIVSDCYEHNVVD
jgi:hypothetical protein